MRFARDASENEILKSQIEELTPTKDSFGEPKVTISSETLTITSFLYF